MAGWFKDQLDTVENQEHNITYLKTFKLKYSISYFDIYQCDTK